jgi:gamma-glutamyltranspeptidase/glutathione hydrolase
MRKTVSLLIATTVVAVSAIALTAMQQSTSPNQDTEGRTPAPPHTMRPVITGRNYAVSSMKPQATEAGVRILEQGGNAFDAAVAAQAVLALTDPAMNGYGSDAVVLVYDAKGKKVTSINAEGTAPKLATIDWYKTHNNNKLPVNDSLLAGTVPGVVDAWYLLLDHWGTMTFAQVLQPAIETAEEGFPIPDALARSMRSRTLAKYPTSMKLYQPDGHPYQEGDIFKNPDAGRLLRKLVEAETNAGGGRRAGLKAARDRFYTGDIARTMAAFSEAQGALFRYEDFASYTAKLEDPVSTNYRGYQIYKNASSTQAPTELFALNMLEGYDLKKMGLNSAEYIHTTAEALKLAMGDREKYLGDTDFIKIPFSGLLSKDYAAERRKLIDPDHASLEVRPGDPSKYMTNASDFVDYPYHVTIDGDASHAGDTSYLAIIDKNRNMVSFEPSNHSEWGTKVVVADLGIIFNCRGDYYSLVPGEANSLAPGKRPRSTLQSTLVMKDGLPYMIMGSPGADDQVMRTMETLLNVVDFGLNVQQAIEAPRWSTRSFPASPFPHTMYPGDLAVESRIPVAVQDALGAKGHKLHVLGPWSLAEMAVIQIDPRTGILNAGADPRVDAYAWAR